MKATVRSEVNADNSAMDTRDRILLTAEALFANHGYSSVSLRTVMTEAGTNVAAAHYYFRSKEGLLEAIFAKRGAALNAERNVLLDQCEQAQREGTLTIRQILTAFLGPVIRLGKQPGGQHFDRLSALCSVDPAPEVKAIVFKTFDQVGKRFNALLRQQCGHLSDEEYYWRLHCLFGSMTYIRSRNGRVDMLLGRNTVNDSAEFILEQLITFIEAGLAKESGGTK